MIKAADAVRIARSLIGTPYGSGAGQIDCINLIKHIIRTAPGGVKKYTTAGTNALWDSFAASRKYKDLTQRENGVTLAKAGMLAFKNSGEDVHHVGLVTGEGTVVHASSKHGKVVETKLTAREGWTLLGVHRYIAVAEKTQAKEAGEAVNAGVYTVCAKGGLRQRDEPRGRYMQMIPEGAALTVETVMQGWGRVYYKRHWGWVDMRYLCQSGDD